MDSNIISKIGSLFVKAKNILIILPGQPSIDATAGALALQISLNEAGKQAILACSEPIKVNFNRLIGVDKITQKIGSQNLVVSFDYIEDSIEKVSYHIADGKFNLVVKPKEGFSPLDTKTISYLYTGANADLIVVVGSKTLEALGRIYREEQKLFIDKETINIDASPINAKFGRINLLEPQASGCCELIGLLIKNLNMPMNADVATNLLAGVETATDNLSTKTRAETFELIADFMKAGGRRGQLETKAPSQPFDNRPFMPQPVNEPMTETNKPAFQSPKMFSGSFQPDNQPADQAQAVRETFQQPKQKNFSQQSPSPDWLKPKIYKGSSQVQ